MTADGVCDGCASGVDDILLRARTSRGVSAARWTWAPASREPRHVLVGRRTLVVHTGEDGPVVRLPARPGVLPLRSRSVPALVVLPVVPDLADLDGLFAELRRVLRPHGLLSMVVPTAPGVGLRHRGLKAGVRSAWVHRSGVEHPDWLLTGADFAVVGDDRLGFRVPVPDDPLAHVDAMSAAGLLPSALTPDLRRSLARNRGVAGGAFTLRRLVARR